MNADLNPSTPLFAAGSTNSAAINPAAAVPKSDIDSATAVSESVLNPAPVVPVSDIDSATAVSESALNPAPVVPVRKKLALVTGASRGIGAAIARELTAHGYDVIMTADQTAGALQEAANTLNAAAAIDSGSLPGNGMTDRESLPGNGMADRESLSPDGTNHREGALGRAMPVICDMADPAAVRSLFSDIRHLDLLVNNAGISWIGLTQDMTDEEWARIVGVNLSSVFYTCRAAIPVFLRQRDTDAVPKEDTGDAGSEEETLSRKKTLLQEKVLSPYETMQDGNKKQSFSCSPCPGRIINISSVWGNVGASCEAAYSATKGGVNAFTRALGKELAPSGIPVNAIACGCVDTVMNNNLSDREKAELSEEIPAGRFASPKEIAAAVWQLANAPAYLTGQVITMDGGWI